MRTKDSHDSPGSKDHQPHVTVANAARPTAKRAAHKKVDKKVAEPDTDADSGATEKATAKKRPLDPAKKRRRFLIGGAIVIVLLVVGLAWWLYSRNYESTDDAQIDGHLNSIASRVAGTVTAVYVENDAPVKAGQPLVDLDPSDYKVQVAQARAAYQQAVAQTAAEDPNVPITETSNGTAADTAAAEVTNAQAAIASAQQDYSSNIAKLRQAEANNRKSQSDLVRYKQLVDKKEISLSDYEQYVANAASESAAVDASRYAAASSAKVVDERRAQLREKQSALVETKDNAPRQIVIRQQNIRSRKANADAAKAQLDMALLNLSYCHIVAPVDGIASQRSAEIGARVAAGQQLIVLVQTGNLWTTANFKETQLRKMHVGQHVTIKVDSLGESFAGEIENMPAATGDRSSLFPPENATGNFVKIVQRLPVRIRFESGQRDLDKLRPGMSAEPKVSLK